MKLYQPVLFVGLGGTGCDIGAVLERRMREEICGPDGNDFRRLRAKAPEAYIIAEKILDLFEELPREMPLQGTTGYDFLNFVNGIFVAAEIALVTVRRSRVEQLASEGSHAAARVRRLIEDPGRFLGITGLTDGLAQCGPGREGQRMLPPVGAPAVIHQRFGCGHRVLLALVG